MGDDAVLVTAQQLSDLMSEIWELLGRYRDAGAGDPSARRVLVGALATPIEPEEAPA
jgi:hypothetical protein